MENTNFKKNYTHFDSSKLFLQSVIIPQIITFVLIMIITSIFTDSSVLTSNIFYIIFALTITQVIFLGIILVFNKQNKVDFKKACCINKKINLMQVLIAILISFVALYSFAPLVNLIDFAMQKIGINTDATFALSFDSFWNFLLMSVCYAIIPAIIEEILFRGMIFNGLRKKGIKFAIIISALIFMLLHASIQQTIYQFALGIILASVFYITGNLIIPMIIHFFNNFFVVLISYLSYGQSSEPVAFNTAMDFISPFIYVIVGCLVIYGLITVIHSFTKEKCPKYDIEPEPENVSFELSDNPQIIDDSCINNDNYQGLNTSQNNIQNMLFKNKNSLSRFYFYSALILSILIIISDLILSI